MIDASSFSESSSSALDSLSTTKFCLNKLLVGGRGRGEGKSGDSSGTSAPARIMVRKALVQESCGCLILNIAIFGRV